MLLNKVYKQTKTGATQEWSIEIVDNKYRTHSGQVGGVITTNEWTVCYGKNVGRANATTDSSGYLRINGDAATNYSWHWLYGTGASVAVSKGATQDKIQIAANYPGSSYSTNIYGVGIIDIHDYASTTKNKTVRIFNGVENNSGTTSSKVNLVSGARFNTAAITSISLTGFNDFATGSTFALYGIKGA